MKGNYYEKLVHYPYENCDDIKAQRGMKEYYVEVIYKLSWKEKFD